MAKARKPAASSRTRETATPNVARHDLDIAIADLRACARVLGDALEGPACLPAATEGLAWLLRSTIRNIATLTDAHRKLESAELAAVKGGGHA